MAVNAMVLAGRATGDALKEYTRGSSKALIDINGKPMIQYVTDALTAARQVDEIIIVGAKDELQGTLNGDRLRIIEGGESIVENIKIAARELPADQRILIATSDIPLITGEIVDAFIAQCQNRKADMYYPIVEKSVNERKYPLVKRTYAGLQEGTFTGGNLTLIEPWIVEPCAPKVKRFIDNRKNVLKLSALLGLPFILKLLLKMLTIAELEAKISTLWGIKAAAVVSPFPEIGIDVDKPSDLQLVRAALS